MNTPIVKSTGRNVPGNTLAGKRLPRGTIRIRKWRLRGAVVQGPGTRTPEHTSTAGTQEPIKNVEPIHVTVTPIDVTSRILAIPAHGASPVTTFSWLQMPLSTFLRLLQWTAPKVRVSTAPLNSSAPLYDHRFLHDT